jgi:hypothetical protein
MPASNSTRFTEAFDLPEEQKYFRQLNQQLPVTYDTISDNPLRHGATYLQFKTRTSYQNRIFLFADLMAEHRGVSYGLYDTKNIALYPVIRVEASDTFRLASQKLIVKGKAGQFLDERLGEGLMIYNIDLQGFQVELGMKDYYFRYTIYGDLYNGIGLNIDDLHTWEAGRRWKNRYVSVMWMLAMPPWMNAKNYQTLQLAGRIEKKNESFYAHLGYRFLPVNQFFIHAIIQRSVCRCIGCGEKIYCT